MRAALLAVLLGVGCGGAVADGTSSSNPPVAPSPPPTAAPPPTSPPTSPALTIDEPNARGRSLAVDETSVFVASEAGGVARFPALLDAKGTTLASGYFGTLALDGASVYAVRDNRTLVRVPKAGGPETVLAVLDAGDTEVVRVAAGGVYFLSVTTAGLEHPILHCTLGRVAKEGGASTLLMTYDGCGDLVVDDHAVYATRDRELLRIPVDGSAPSILLTLTGNDAWAPLSLAQDDLRIWIASYGSRIFSVAKAGGAVEQRATTAGLPSSLTVAGDDLYWLERVSDLSGPPRADLMTAPKGGGPARKLLDAVAEVQAVAVNNDAVYCAGRGPLHRVARH